MQELKAQKTGIFICMNSLLIYGGNKTNRNNRVGEFLLSLKFKKANNPDLMVVEKLEGKRGIGIAQIKEGLAFLSSKPFSSEIKVLIVYGAQDLTIEAQNALLKTLEEPPAYAYIVLETTTKNSVLPTILSRCKRVEVSNNGGIVESGEKTNIDSDTLVSFADFLNADIGKRLEWGTELGKMEREEAVETLQSWVLEARELLVNSGGAGGNALAWKVERLVELLKDLDETNVNQKLLFEHLAINL